MLPVDRHRIFYSVITRCELFAGTRTDELGIGRLLGALSELIVDRQISEEAGRLRRLMGTPTADALIAATALTTGLRLFTRNQRHFAAIPGLRLHSF